LITNNQEDEFYLNIVIPEGLRDELSMDVNIKALLTTDNEKYRT